MAAVKLLEFACIFLRACGPAFRHGSIRRSAWGEVSMSLVRRVYASQVGLHFTPASALQHFRQTRRAEHVIKLVFYCLSGLLGMHPEHRRLGLFGSVRHGGTVGEW